MYSDMEFYWDVNDDRLCSDKINGGRCDLYDSRIQMGIGNEKVKILGDNIFSFICSIGENQIPTVSFEED
ncbi:MAG: hypothetical protein K1W22_01340 [Lachnospiraceae bacterium]